ncbi:hypothetical protein BCV72DRAFT_219804 [Rhizopus microsporus var. microsporus]|nr:hypothetical protein BCV72DRAFT_219804 [Rhizopus microsporus var. microsporus]
MMMLLNSLIQPCMFTVITNNVGVTHGLIKLESGANRIMTTSSNEGSSEYCKALSIERFNRLVGFDLVKTETEMKVAEELLFELNPEVTSVKSISDAEKSLAFTMPSALHLNLRSSIPFCFNWVVIESSSVCPGQKEMSW